MWVKQPEYGVIRDSVLHKEVFFHRNYNPSIEILRPSSYCIYNLEPDRKRGGSMAVGITLIEEASESHLFELVYAHVDKIMGAAITEKVLPRLSSGNVDRILHKLLYVLDRVESPESYSRAVDIIRLFQCMGREFATAISRRIADQSSSHFRFRFWLDGHLEEIPTTLVAHYLPMLSPEERGRVFRSKKGDDLLDVFLKILEKDSSQIENFREGLVGEILGASKNWPTEQRSQILAAIQGRCNPLSKIRLWLDGYTEEADIALIAEHYFFLSLADQKEVERRSKRIDLIRICFEVLNTKMQLDDTTRIAFVLGMVEASKYWSDEERTMMIDGIWDRSGPHIRVMLWLRGIASRYDHSEFRWQFLFLSSADQFLYLRRLIHDAEQKRIDLAVEMLDELVRFKEDPSFDGQLDCSIDVAIRILVDLKKGLQISEEEHVGKVLSRHFIRKPNGRFLIKEFFDLCEGRGYIEKADSTMDPPKIISCRRGELPNGVHFCEGRKAHNPDRVYGVEFWWCRNTPCYMPCHSVHPPEQWSRYTLRDFLRVLAIPFEEEVYQTFLGFLNRVNELLPHLNCRECGWIMSPKDQSNFGFYRASRFHCINPECTSTNEIYLTHCLNPRCGNCVDSRDSAQCPNAYHVCTYCFSCCSNRGFERRLRNLETVGKPAPEWLRIAVAEGKGHAEKDEHFCFKCGSQLVGGNSRYKDTLNWLIENAKSDQRIRKAGRRQKDGGWWFVVDFPEEKYASLSTIGFDIAPANNSEGRLVSERRDRPEPSFGSCPNESCERHGTKCQAKYSRKATRVAPK